MKQPVRDLIAALVRIVDNDLDELRGHIVHVDEKHVATLDELRQRWTRLDDRLSEVEAVLADNANHSRKATPAHFFTGERNAPCIHCGMPYGDHPARAADLS